MMEKVFKKCGKVFKNLDFILFLFLILPDVYGETEYHKSSLEYLWNCTLLNNFNIKEAEFERDLINRNLNYYWQRYIPAVTVSTNSSNDFSTGNNILSTNDFSSSVIISESFPSGTTIEIAPSLSLSKNLLYSAEDAKSYQYCDNVKLGVEISQKIFPFWSSNGKFNNEKQLLEIEQRKSELLLQMEILSSYQKISENFINSRVCLRKIDSKKQILSYYLEKLNSFEELNSRQNIAVISLFSLNEEISGIKDSIKDLEFEFNQYILTLQQCIGFGGQNESNLNDLSSFDFFSQLPESICLFSENPSLVLNDFEIESLETEYCIIKQNNAPVLSVAGSLPIHQSNTNSLTALMGMDSSKQFNLSVGLDFSSFIDSGYKREDRKVKQQIELLRQKRIVLEENCAKEKQFYKNARNNEEKLLSESYQIFSNKQQVYSEYELLFSKGECSYLDLLEKKTYLKVVENDIRNLIDRIWYFGWMEVNCW